MFYRKLLTCLTHIGLRPLEPPMPVIALGTPTGDEYRATLDDGNVAKDKALPGGIVKQARGVIGTIAVSCKPALVDIRRVLERLFRLEVSASTGPHRHVDVLSFPLLKSST